jgi:hypothetical protein
MRVPRVRASSQPLLQFSRDARVRNLALFSLAFAGLTFLRDQLSHVQLTPSLLLKHTSRADLSELQLIPVPLLSVYRHAHPSSRAIQTVSPAGDIPPPFEASQGQSPLKG